MEAQGTQVKVVFLMRDPLERCWSAVRMYKRNNRSHQGVDITLSDDLALRAYLRTADAKLRTQYHFTLDRLNHVFASQDIFVGCYEALFTAAEVDRLSTFFSLPSNHKFVCQRFNQTKISGKISDETITLMQSDYAEVYARCLHDYPDFAALWSSMPRMPAVSPAG